MNNNFNQTNSDGNRSQQTGDCNSTSGPRRTFGDVEPRSADNTGLSPSSEAPMNFSMLKCEEPVLDLRDVLERYSNQPELLNNILIAKAEQDRLKSEELRHQTELLRFETKKMELQMMNQTGSSQMGYASRGFHSEEDLSFGHNRSNLPFSPTMLSPNQSMESFVLSPPPNGSFADHMGRGGQYGRHQSGGYPYYSGQVGEDEMYSIGHQLNNVNLRSPTHNYPRTFGKSPYKHQNPSREEVMMALRNKVRANSFAKANPYGQHDFSSQENLHLRSNSFDSKMDN